MSVPRINLLASMPDQNDAPSAGTVTVTFNGNDNSVTLSNANVSVDKEKMRVLFDLSSSNLPSGASVAIEGIEFTKPNEPTGSYAPGTNIFENQNTFTDQDGAAHTVYGEWKSGKARLKLVDKDNVGATGTEQDYGYRVWVKLTSGSSTNYYSSPDPQISNKPTTG